MKKILLKKYCIILLGKPSNIFDNNKSSEKFLSINASFNIIDNIKLKNNVIIIINRKKHNIDK